MPVPIEPHQVRASSPRGPRATSGNRTDKKPDEKGTWGIGQ